MDPEKAMCVAAYKLARSYIEWKDMAQAHTLHPPSETQDAWMRLSMAEELFRRHLDGPEGRPCEGCPDGQIGQGGGHIPHDIRSFDLREDS